MTTEAKRLIRVRTEKGASFKRDGYGKKRQLSDSWRKPRGQHNKQREQKKAKGALPKPGFGSPVAVRGMHPSGFFEALVATAKELEGLDPKTQAIRISGTVGSLKRAALQEAAITAGFRVLNPKIAAKAKPKAGKPAKPADAPKKTEKKPETLGASLVKKVTGAGKKEKPADKKASAKAEKKAETKSATKSEGKSTAKPAKEPAKDSAKPKAAKPAEGKGKESAKPTAAQKKKTDSEVKKHD
jgi:large subunit ribosomal protein L32e